MLWDSGLNPTIFKDVLKMINENTLNCTCECCLCTLTEENTHYEYGPASPCQHCVYLTQNTECLYEQ